MFTYQDSFLYVNLTAAESSGARCMILCQVQEEVAVLGFGWRVDKERAPPSTDHKDIPSRITAAL